MSNKSNLWNDPGFEPFDSDAHARELEQNDPFNRLTSDAIPVRGGLRTRLEELANSGNREVLAVLEENNISDPRVPRVFYCADGTPGRIFADADGWHALIPTSEGNEIRFTNADRDFALAAASRYCDRTREPRELSQAERIHIARLAQSGKIKEALIEYIKCRLGNADLDSPEADVRYRHVYNQAAFDVWRFSENTYVGNPQFEQLLGQVAEEKPLTFKLIADLYRSYLTQKPSSRPATENPETEPVVSDEDLDRMTDKEIAKLHSGVVKNRARQVSQIDRATLGR